MWWQMHTAAGLPAPSGKACRLQESWESPGRVRAGFPGPVTGMQSGHKLTSAAWAMSASPEKEKRDRIGSPRAHSPEVPSEEQECRPALPGKPQLTPCAPVLQALNPTVSHPASSYSQRKAAFLWSPSCGCAGILDVTLIHACRQVLRKHGSQRLPGMPAENGGTTSHAHCARPPSL